MNCYFAFVCVKTSLVRIVRRSERWSKSLGEASEAKCASVNGVVASVSPMKKGKRAAFFEVKITDGDVHMRVVGFQDARQQKLATFQKYLGRYRCGIARSSTPGFWTSWKSSWVSLCMWRRRRRSLWLVI